MIPDECFSCDCYDSDMGCTAPSGQPWVCPMNDDEDWRKGLEESE